MIKNARKNTFLLPNLSERVPNSHIPTRFPIKKADWERLGSESLSQIRSHWVKKNNNKICDNYRWKAHWTGDFYYHSVEIWSGDQAKISSIMSLLASFIWTMCIETLFWGITVHVWVQKRMECKQLSTLESYGLIPKQKSNMWQFGLGMLVCARLWTCTASGREGRNLVILLECGNSLMFCEYTCTCLSETKGGVG